MKSVHILSYFLNKVGGSRLKLQVTLAGSSATANVWAPAWAGHPFQPLTLQCSSTLRQGEGWRECSIVRNRAAQTRLGMASEQWGGEPLLHLWRQPIRNSLELWLGPGQPQLKPWPTVSTCSSLSCSSIAPFWGEGAHAGRGKKHTLWNRASSDKNPKDFCFSNLEPAPAPN